MTTADLAWPALAAIGLTLVSGLGDSYGFIHAARAWSGGAIVISELARSGLGFVIGIGSYWLVVRYLETLGVTSATVQTAGWFAVTLVGVALATGEFVRWPLIDQAVAVWVLLGLGWLLVRVETR
jgi:hypothetical protein